MFVANVINCVVCLSSTSDLHDVLVSRNQAVRNQTTSRLFDNRIQSCLTFANLASSDLLDSKPYNRIPSAKATPFGAWWDC